MSDWNDKVIAEFRANGGHTEHFGDTLVVLHSIGAKSGDVKLNPVMGLRDGDGWLVMASKGGAPENPGWYYNLVAHPDIDMEAAENGAAVTLPVTVRELGDDEYPAAFARFTTAAPGFLEYEKRTTRRMPLFEITRR